MDTCSIINVDLQIIDKSPFFIRPFYVKEEDKPIIAKNAKVGKFRYFNAGHVTIFLTYSA